MRRLHAVRRRHGSPPRAWGRPAVGTRRPRRRRPVHPHARGDDSGDPVSALDRRFTPTRVGTTLRLAAAHGATVGSPPRAWGRRLSARSPGRARTVHPHASGDDPTPGAPPPRAVPPPAGGDDARRRAATLLPGSPPPAWGRRVASSPTSSTPPAHPHARGDDARRVAACSSTAVHPHARGDDGAVEAFGARFGAVAAHPHPRGDDACDEARSGAAHRGSPPRAWGRRRCGE